MIEKKDVSQHSSLAAGNERRERRVYLWGAVIALVLTAIPFALVHWMGMAGTTVVAIIGACGLLQIAIHLRFFLHIGFSHQREDLQLILFSVLLIIIMVGGTIWIMGSLAQRM